MSWNEYIPKQISKLYEIHDYKHAAAILSQEFPNEFKELCSVLNVFRFTMGDIMAKGGSESNIPKKFSKILRPLNWEEKNLSAELNVFEVKSKKDKK